MEGSKNSLKISSKPQVVTPALCSADNCSTAVEDSAESTDDGALAFCPNSPLPPHPTTLFQGRAHSKKPNSRNESVGQKETRGLLGERQQGSGDA